MLEHQAVAPFQRVSEVSTRERVLQGQCRRDDGFPTIKVSEVSTRERVLQALSQWLYNGCMTPFQRSRPERGYCKGHVRGHYPTGQVGFRGLDPREGPAS